MSADGIDWSDLQACYGPATSVPALLQQLASRQADERSDAISDLWGCLCHQGTVYEASAAAVPFLFAELPPDRQLRRLVLELAATERL